MHQLILTSMAVVFLLLSGCSTLIEVANPNDSPLGYTKKLGKSNTYVRKARNPVANHSIEEEESWDPVRWQVHNQSFNRKASTELNELTSALHSTLADDSPSAFTIGFSAAVLGENSNLQSGLEIEAPLVEDWITGRLGASVFNSDKIYLGGTVGLRVSAPKWPISPYVGGEAYLGDHKSCTTEIEQTPWGAESVETCEKTFLGTLYFESGIKFDIDKHARFYLFTRGYSKIDQTVRRELSMFYGVSLFFGNL